MENPLIIEITKIPSTIEEFIILRDQLAISPEGGAAVFLLALKTYIDNPELAKQFLVASVDMQRLTAGNTYKGYDLNSSDLNLMKSQLNNNPRIPDSYIEGSSPENNYKTQLPYKFVFSGNKYSGDKEKGTYKLFVKCSGADTPRPMSMKRNDKGIWKAMEWSTLVVGIKKPPVKDDI
jgi:hypothetical protein